MAGKVLKDTTMAYFNEGTLLVRDAIAKDRAGQYAEAIQAYQGAITKFRLACAGQSTHPVAEKAVYQIDQCAKRIGELEIALRNAPPPPPPPPPAKTIYNEGKQLQMSAEAKYKQHDNDGARQLFMTARAKMSEACLTFQKPLNDEERRQAHLDMIAIEKRLMSIP